MENAVDALKIAFGMFIFVMALTLAFSVVGQARAASESILTLNDKTSFYDYVEENEEESARNTDRIVGFETILPTIYRYAKEQYAVTIIDNTGNIVVRYDLYTEGFMQDWDEMIKLKNKGDSNSTTRYNEIEARIAKVDEFIQKETNKSNTVWNAINNRSLYEGANGNINSSSSVVAPWMGDYNNDIVERIRADINGEVYEKNNIRYQGKGLINYKNSRFKEKFIEIQTSGTTITVQDDNTNIEYSLETVKGNKTLEIVYIEQ